MADAFIGEIRAFSFGWAPSDWMICDGSLVSLAQYQALYAVIGTTFGGDGKSTFGLPNLTSRAPIGSGQGPGLSRHIIGQTLGELAVTLNENTMPAHTHPLLGGTATSATSETGIPDATSYVSRFSNTSTTPAKVINAYVNAAVTPINTTMAPSMLGPYGGGLGHENRQPVLTMTFCICMIGWFPARQD